MSVFHQIDREKHLSLAPHRAPKDGLMTSSLSPSHGAQVISYLQERDRENHLYVAADRAPKDGLRTSGNSGTSITSCTVSPRAPGLKHSPTD